MVATPAFNSRQEEYSKTLFEGLLTKLKHWISPVTLSSYQADLWNDIFDPALKLHQAMACSSTQYKFYGADFTRGIVPEKSGPCTVKNIKTWTQISSSDVDWVPFHDQFPGLHRIDKDKDLELVRPVVIAFKREDLRSLIPSPPPCDSEVYLNTSKPLSLEPPTTSISSSQSDSRRGERNPNQSLRKGKSKPKSPEGKWKRPNYAEESYVDLVFGHARLAKVRQDQSRHDRDPSSKHDRPPSHESMHGDMKSPPPRTLHPQPMSNSQIAPPGRVRTFHEATSHVG